LRDWAIHHPAPEYSLAAYYEERAATYAALSTTRSVLRGHSDRVAQNHPRSCHDLDEIARVVSNESALETALANPDGLQPSTILSHIMKGDHQIYLTYEDLWAPLLSFVHNA
jgi:hypothetical protein